MATLDLCQHHVAKLGNQLPIDDLAVVLMGAGFDRGLFGGKPSAQVIVEAVLSHKLAGIFAAR